MKNITKIGLIITTGILASCTFISCGNKNRVEAAEEQYLTYCGKQKIGEKTVRIYEDVEHNKVVYVGSDGFQHPISVAVSDLEK